MKATKPLWGFGWVGWCLLPIAAALVWVYCSGYDLRFKILEQINNTLGIKAVYWTVLNPINHNWIALDLPGFGWWALLWVFLALQIHPRRVAWYWWIVLVSWPAFRAALFFRFIRVPGASPTGAILAMSGGYLDASGAAFLVLGVVDVLLLMAVSRSWLVACAVGAATMVGIVAFGLIYLPPGPSSKFVEQLPAYLWHAIAGGAMLTWAVQGRLKRLPPGFCTTCGYDMRGSPPERCPECGTLAPTSNAQPVGVDSAP